MKITGIYIIDGRPLHNLITTPDGKMYLFRASPYRKLTVRDLEEVKTSLPENLYIKAVHAYKPTESYLKSLPLYGLDLVI